MADQTNISRAQKLLEEMNAKYGPTPSAPTVQPATQPQVQQPVQQPQQRGLVNDAMSLIKGRQQQIDKASGYSCGGKVKAHAYGGEIESDDGSAEANATHQEGLALLEHGRSRDAMESQRLANAFAALAGYASGGKVKPNVTGGKIKTIKGPGTSTSDSIPAKIKQTGEPILVSNGERILSKKQDQLLSKIAKMLGYDSTDALLASGTGRPVGPTMKDGKKAAKDGSDWLDIVTSAISPVAPAVAATNAAPALATDIGSKIFSAQDEKIGPSTKTVGLDKIPEMFADAAKASDTTNTKTYEQIRAEREAGQSAGSSSQDTRNIILPKKPEMSVDQNSLTSRLINAPQQNTPDNYTEEKTAVSPLITGRNDNGVITAESAQKYLGNDMQRSGGVFGTMDLAGQNERMVKSLGYANVDEFNKKWAEKYRDDPPPPGGWAPSILGDGGIAADNAEKTQRWRNDELARQAKNGNQAAIGALMDADSHRDVAAIGNETNRQNAMLAAQAANNRDQATMRGQDIQAQADAAKTIGSPAENRVKMAQAADAEQISALRGKFLDPKTSDEEKIRIKALLNSIFGRSADDKPWAHVVGGGVDPTTGQLAPQYIVTGRGDQATTASTGADIANRAKQKPIPEGYTVAGTSGGKRVLQDAKGNRFLES